MQLRTATMLSSLTGSYSAAFPLTNTSSVASNLSISSSSTCDITCMVIIGAITASFGNTVYNSTTTVLETVFVSNGTPITTGTPIASPQPSYSSSAAITTGWDPCYPSIYENGTVTGCGTELIFTSDYIGVQGIEIFTDCSNSMCTALSDCSALREGPDLTGFPFRGITTTGYYWINAGIGWESPDTQPFFSLLDLPNGCDFVPIGPPWALMPVTQLTETQTITSPYQGPKTPTAAAPGSTVTPTTLTPSSTSGGQYYLSTASPMSGTTSQPLSSGSPPIQQSLSPITRSLGSLETTTEIATPSQGLSSLSALQSIDISPQKSLSHITSSLESLETTTETATPSQGLSPLSASQSIEISPQLDITVAGSTISPIATGLYLVGSETLAVGGSAITVAGTTISMASSVIVVNGYTQSLAADLSSSVNPPIVTIGSLIATADSSELYLIGTQTLTPGGPAITASGTTISLATSATALFLNGATQTIAITTDSPPSISAPIPAIATIDGQALSLNSAGVYEVGSQTVTPGGPAVTVDGTPVSLATSAIALFINGATQTIATNPILLPTSPPSTEPPLILGGTTLNANSAGAYLLGTQSLIPGGAAMTVSGTTISLAPSDAAIIVDGQTYTANLPPSISAPIPAIATIDGQVLSLNSAGDYEVGSQTVTPGEPAVTVDGTVVSLETVGTGVDLIIGGSTEAFTAVETSSTAGLAGIIISALGGPLPSQTTTTSATGNPPIDTSEARACWEIDWRVSAVFVILAVQQVCLYC